MYPAATPCAVPPLVVATDPTTGETHLRHHITKDGYYRGKKVVDVKGAVDQD